MYPYGYWTSSAEPAQYMIQLSKHYSMIAEAGQYTNQNLIITIATFIMAIYKHRL